MAKTELLIGNLSDLGKKRTVNEDYYGAFKGDFGNLIVVCDGMGGHKGGATASRIAVETIKLHFEKLSKNFNPIEELKNSLLKADSNILQKAAESEDLKDMGSTAVVLLIKDNNAYFAHIGDSRIYLIRENKIHQLTKDHSLVQQLVDSGIIDEETAKTHPQRNVISRSLGAEGKNQPDIAEPITVFKNDIFILCTDGLSGYLSDNELLELATKNDPQTACVKMVNLANERGGKDNITVQVVKVTKGKRLPLRLPKQIKNLVLPITTGLFGVIVLLIILLISFPDSTEESQNTNNSDSTKKEIIKKEKNIELKDSVALTMDSAKLPSLNDTITGIKIQSYKDTQRVIIKKNNKEK
jgi:serine/threonine protein phosphatase PrpC